MESNTYIHTVSFCLSGDVEDPCVFWAMVMNFNSFGTVALFHENCDCIIDRLPEEQRELISKWDMILNRVKENEFDVQCMFSETPIGCHNLEIVLLNMKSSPLNINTD